MINNELTTELKDIIETDYNCKLSDQEAIEFGEQLLASYEALIKLNDVEHNNLIC